MKHGPAWIIIEQSTSDGTKALLSILPPRKNVWDVAKFVEQLCVDRYASIAERLQFKKSMRSFGFKPMIEGHVMHCGHDPIVIAIRAQETILRGDQLEFRYRIITRHGVDHEDFTHEERVQTLVVRD